MLCEENGHSPLLVEAAKEPDQLVPSHRVQLGSWLVEEDQARTGDEGSSEGDPLELSTGQGVNGAVQQVWNGQSQGDLLDRPGARGRWISPHLKRQLDLGRNGGRDDLGLGVLGDVADDRGQLSRSGGDRVDSGHLDPAVDLSTVEVRDEAAGSAEQRRLARGGAAGEEGELAGGKSE